MHFVMLPASALSFALVRTDRSFFLAYKQYLIFCYLYNLSDGASVLDALVNGPRIRVPVPHIKPTFSNLTI